MVRTGTRRGDEGVYEVVSRFKDVGMRQRQSVFDPPRPAWSLASFRELERELASEPDTSGGSFESKLKTQLGRVDENARLLMAELLTLHVLITTTIGRAKKEEIVGSALGTMSTPPPILSNSVWLPSPRCSTARRPDQIPAHRPSLKPSKHKTA